MSDEAVRKAAFRQIMAALDMPDDAGPDYDEWLFNRSWQASRSAAIQECADKLQMFHDAIIPNSVCVSTAQYVLKAGRKAIIDLKDAR